jgi:hypothetical protein
MKTNLRDRGKLPSSLRADLSFVVVEVCELVKR